MKTLKDIYNNFPFLYLVFLCVAFIYNDFKGESLGFTFMLFGMIFLVLDFYRIKKRNN